MWWWYGYFGGFVAVDAGPYAVADAGGFCVFVAVLLDWALCADLLCWLVCAAASGVGGEPEVGVGVGGAESLGFPCEVHAATGFGLMVDSYAWPLIGQTSRPMESQWP